MKTPIQRAVLIIFPKIIEEARMLFFRYGFAVEKVVMHFKEHLIFKINPLSVFKVGMILATKRFHDTVNLIAVFGVHDNVRVAHCALRRHRIKGGCRCALDHKEVNVFFLCFLFELF